MRPAYPAGRELLAERGSVLGVQVDLIVGAIEGEPHSLHRRAAGQVVFQGDGYFLCHQCLPLLRWWLHRTRPVSLSQPQRRGHA
jgi:hypothetical protein